MFLLRVGRVVPIGERALAWIDRYNNEARPALLKGTGENTLFLSYRGKPLIPTFLSNLVRKYFDQAEIKQPGSCHLFRHTAATQMLEHGADIRILQEFLGHERLDATQIYTHVSIAQLKAVHERTHPAEQPRSLGQPVHERPQGTHGMALGGDTTL
jgi:integrase/recombinase XerD